VLLERGEGEREAPKEKSELRKVSTAGGEGQKMDGGECWLLRGLRGVAEVGEEGCTTERGEPILEAMQVPRVAFISMMASLSLSFSIPSLCAHHCLLHRSSLGCC